MTRIAILLLAVLALGLAACGGDDDDGDATPATGAGTGSSAEALPKDEFIERGDQICKDLQKKAQALGREAQDLAGVPLDDPQTTKAAAKIWHKQVDLVPPALGIAELEVGPRAERRRVGQYAAHQRQALGLVGELRRGHLDPAVAP